MSTPTTATARVREFVTQVGQHFDDLSEADRAELLQDLEEHLLEVAAEDSGALEAELVEPRAYAAELRRSAGLAEPARRPLRTRLPEALREARQRPWVTATLEFMPQLRPAWWVARAWALLVVFAAWVAGDRLAAHVPVPGRHPLGLVLLLGAAVLSVRLARSSRQRWERIADVAGVVAMLSIVWALATSPTLGYAETAAVESPLPVLRHPDGEPITNLYVFDEDGRLLDGVFVFDGRGRPVEVGDLRAAGFRDLETDLPRDAFGTPIGHRYPLEQYAREVDEEGRLVRVPRELPPIGLPRIEEPVQQTMTPSATPTPTATSADPGAESDPSAEADPSREADPSTEPDPSTEADPSTDPSGEAGPGADPDPSAEPSGEADASDGPTPGETTSP